MRELTGLHTRDLPVRGRVFLRLCGGDFQRKKDLTSVPAQTAVTGRELQKSDNCLGA